MPGADATDIQASSRPEEGPGNAVVTAMAAVAKSAQNREVSRAGEQQHQQHIVVVSHNSSSKREKTQAKKKCLIKLGYDRLLARIGTHTKEVFGVLQ